MEDDPSEYTFSQPPKPEWEWCVGGDWFSMTFHVMTRPHWLGRLLQKYLLDIHWRKIK